MKIYFVTRYLNYFGTEVNEMYWNKEHMIKELKNIDDYTLRTAYITNEQLKKFIKKAQKELKGGTYEN